MKDRQWSWWGDNRDGHCDRCRGMQSVPSSGLIHKCPSFLEYLLTTHSSQLCLSVGTALPKVWPSPLHISQVALGQWLPGWRFKSLTLLPQFRRILKSHSGSRTLHRICFGLHYNLITSEFLLRPKLSFFTSSHMYTSRTLPSKPSAYQFSPKNSFIQKAALGSWLSKWVFRDGLVIGSLAAQTPSLVVGGVELACEIL